LHNKFFETT